MFIASIPNRGSPPTILIRESYREAGKVKSRTLLNITQWPEAKIAGLKRVLRGDATTGSTVPLTIERTRPHGHVAAVLGTIERLRLQKLLGRESGKVNKLIVAMIVSRILEPRSKFATARALNGETLHSSLGEVLEVSKVNEDDLYEAMDRLLDRQEQIENTLAKRHLKDGTLTLYDVTSTYFEGHTCPLAFRGYSRDGKRDKLQIVIGLLCDAEGRPIAIEVFKGNTGDPKTVKSQIAKLKKRFKLKRVVIVGDRGMLTSARIVNDVIVEKDIDWITALRAPAIKKLLASGALQLSFFDTKDLGEISSPDFPGERLIVCKNPLLCEERARKRRELLAATEKKLDAIRVAVERKKRPLHGKDLIGIRAGKVLARSKMGKHFKLHIEDNSFRFERCDDRVTNEASLDGIYIIRTSLSSEAMGAPEVVRSYKQLAQVERAFRSMKTIDLKIRPIYHHLERRVRAHVFLCMLAYYVEWDMRRSLAPILFDDDDRASAAASRSSIVAPAPRSDSAMDKDTSKTTPDKRPVQSFQSLLLDLATIALNRCRIGDETHDIMTQPTDLQRHAFKLLRVPLRPSSQATA